MGTEQTLEIPRDRSGNAWRLGGGAFMILTAIAAVTGSPDAWLMATIIGVIGVALVVVNARRLVTSPPQLRATSTGVWFGIGPTIPWQAIASIYEAGLPVERYGYKVRTHAIAFVFHHKRTLFRLPPSLWFTSLSFGNVRVSVRAATQPPMTLVCQLEAMRTAACGHEDGAIPGASDVPPARVVDRS